MEGEASLPLSWRSYLYANGNPLIYVDRDGNIAFLAEGADALGQFNDWLKGRTSQYGDGALAMAGAAATGIARGFVAGSEGLLRGVDFGANVITNAAGGFGSQELQRATEAELDKTFGTATKAYDAIANQGGAKQLAGKALDTVDKAVHGDPNAIGDVAEFGGGFVSGGGGAVRGAAITARATEKAIATTKRVVGKATERAKSMVTNPKKSAITSEGESLGVDAAKIETTRSAEAVPSVANTGRALQGDLAAVWKLRDTARGNAIESHLASTDYKDWFWVGKENNGYFPLVDFQNGNTLVSLKSVNTNGSTWMTRMQDHIYDLGTNGATVDGRAASMALDLRVQPGGMKAALPLINYGRQNGVTVIVKEFK